MRRTLLYAAEVCEPRSSVSPSAHIVRMDVTVSALNVADKLIELREAQSTVPIPKTMKKIGKDRFLGLTLPSGATQTQPMMIGLPALIVKCFVKKTL